MDEHVDATRSAEINEIAAALAKAQGQFAVPKKSHTATVPTKTGGKYEYRYSTLDELIEATKPALAVNGLALIESIEERPGAIGVSAVLLHSSGQWISFPACYMPAGDTPQSRGGALTYSRRYLESAVLRIAAEEDKDASLPQGDAEGRKVKPAVRPAVTPARVSVAIDGRELAEAWTAAQVPPATREAGDEPQDDIAEIMPDEAPAPRLRPGLPGDVTISAPQQKRLFAISMQKGWTKDSLRELLATCGYEHSKDITKNHYEDIITAIEAGPR